MTPFGVIFDLDGLLADTEPLWTESGQLLLSRRGQRFDPQLKQRFMGRRPLEVAAMLVQHYRLTDTPEALWHERLSILRQLYTSRPIRPMAGALELVHALSAAAVPMAVASGSPQELLQIVLQRLQLRRLIAVQLGSDQVSRGKPAPDLFLLAARELQLQPAQCVVLEDAIAGIDAARAAGMACVAVPGPETPLAAVQHAHLVLRSLERLQPDQLRRLTAPGRADGRLSNRRSP